MSSDDVVGLVIAVLIGAYLVIALLIGAYLVIALLFPEKL